MTEEYLMPEDDNSEENTTSMHSVSGSSEQHPDTSSSTSSSEFQNYLSDKSIFEESSTNSSIASLISSIDELQNEVKFQKSETEKWKKLAKCLEKELKSLKASVKNYLEPDQINAMSGKKVKWSNKTIKKGLILRYKLGNKFFNKTFRGKYAPFPEKTTLLRRVKPFKINPGILKLNIEVLAVKMEKIPRNQRSIGILIDDKAIIPSCQQQDNKNYLGFTTLLPSKAIRKKEGDKPRAKNALVALAVGMCIREKDIVGLHYVAGCTDGEALKTFLFELIQYVEKKANVDVDWVGFDCGPSNQSFLNACGISLSSDNHSFSIQHPNRPNDQLFLNPDQVHNKKNLISALRKNDFLFSQSLVDLFNLNTKKVSFTDIKKLFNMQEKIEMKPARQLKQDNIQPQHFETMREKVAYGVFSPDVFTAIQFIDKNADKNDKKNATAVFLQIINYFHEITDDKKGWLSSEKEKYEKDVEFLLWFSDEFLPNIKFKTSLRCVPAISMSIRCLVTMSQLYFNKGYERVVPARFLSNAIENIFSMVTSIFKKPTAASMAIALRIISLQQFEFDSMSTSYGWDETEKPSLDIIELIKLYGESEDVSSKGEEEEEEGFIKFNIVIQDEVKAEDIFQTPLEINVFFIEMAEFLTLILSIIKCEECKLMLVDDTNVESAKSHLLMLKQEASQAGKVIYQPSHALWKYLLRLEFLFQSLSKLKPAQHEDFSSIFMENASKVLVPNEHCFDSTAKIMTSFLKKRLKMSLHCYLPHKSIKHASKSLV